MAFSIIITDVGRAAIVNAQNTGTAPVTIATIGLTETAFTPDADMTALADQLKTLATVGGQVVDADTIHVTISDESADTYSLRGFGLYLADGTLFAVYGQADPIIEKAAGALALLAVDVKFTDIDATSLTFGATDWLNPPASHAAPGVVQLATAAEAEAGANDTKAVTPAALLAALGVLVTWANIIGKPASFPPSDHTHDAADIVSGILAAALLPAATTAAQGAVQLATAAEAEAGANATKAVTPATLAAALTTLVAWANITGKPGTFPPSAHTHDAGDIISGILAAARLPAATTAAQGAVELALAADVGAGTDAAKAVTAAAIAGSGMVAQTWFSNTLTGLATTSTSFQDLSNTIAVTKRRGSNWILWFCVAQFKNDDTSSPGGAQGSLQVAYDTGGARTALGQAVTIGSIGGGSGFKSAETAVAISLDAGALPKSHTIRPQFCSAGGLYAQVSNITLFGIEIWK